MNNTMFKRLSNPFDPFPSIDSSNSDILKFIQDLPRTNDDIDISKLTRIGEGGTQRVYQLTTKHPFLLKVHNRSLEQTDERRQGHVKQPVSDQKTLNKHFGQQLDVLKQ